MTLSTGQNRTYSTQNSKYINAWDMTLSTEQNRTNSNQNSKYINVWDIHHNPKHWAQLHKFNPKQ